MPRKTLASFAVAAAALVCAALPQAVAQGYPDPAALVRRASHNELQSNNANGQSVRYKLRKVDVKGVTTKEIVETKDGGVARLIAIDDKPLTPEQQKKELDRLNELLAHPEIQEHRRKREQEDDARANEMIRLLPDAFLYKSAGMVQGPSGPAYRLTFVPNPSFQPPDREAEVYHGMVGELWIDKGQERLVKIDAHLIADVDFGWGILGRLYKGGSIMVEQADVGHHHWEATHMRLNLTGKAMMVKSLDFSTTEDSTDFQPVPHDLSYQDAVHLLEASDSASMAALNSR
ncbi:MAG TPA: hypothetical protein VGD59_07210 [Acidisarcina sp.]